MRFLKTIKEFIIQISISDLFFKKIYKIYFFMKTMILKSPLTNHLLKKISRALIFLKKNLVRIPGLDKIMTYIPVIQSFIDQSPFFEKINSVQKKYTVFLFVAILVSLGIFYFMSVLISTGKNQKFVENQDVNIEFLLHDSIENLKLRSRQLPKKPEEEEPPPETPKLKVQQTEMEKPELISQLPQLELPEDFQSDEKGASVGQAIRDQEVTPIFRMKPIYPRRAALQNIEGFVVLKFDITEQGQVDNISVIQASPPQIFNSNAIQALRKWKYKPRIENGKAIRQKNLQVQLDFELVND